MKKVSFCIIFLLILFLSANLFAQDIQSGRELPKKEWYSLQIVSEDMSGFMNNVFTAPLPWGPGDERYANMGGVVWQNYDPPGPTPAADSACYMMGVPDNPAGNPNDDPCWVGVAVGGPGGAADTHLMDGSVIVPTDIGLETLSGVYGWNTTDWAAVWSDPLDATGKPNTRKGLDTLSAVYGLDSGTSTWKPTSWVNLLNAPTTSDNGLVTSSVTYGYDGGFFFPIMQDQITQSLTVGASDRAVKSISYLYGQDQITGPPTDWQSVEVWPSIQTGASINHNLLVSAGIQYVYDTVDTDLEPVAGISYLNGDNTPDWRTPYTTAALMARDPTGVNADPVDLIVIHADDQPLSYNGLVTASYLYGYDYTSGNMDLLRLDTSKNLHITKQDTLTLLNSASGVAVDDTAGGTVVLGPLLVTNYPNWTFYIKNAGGGSGDAFSDVWVEASANGSDWINLSAAESALEQEANTLASGNSGIAMMGSNSSISYVRLKALCAAGDDTTANGNFSANKN